MWRAPYFFPRHQNWPCLQSHVNEIRKSFTNSSSILQQQVKSEVKPYNSDFKEGQEIEGFTVQNVSEVPEFQLRAIQLEHQNTGAQYLHLERDDSNNVFSINLRTTPFNSSGVPHILEHTTLCGSKSYPCKDPFFKMLNRSLATFLNAMTAPDYTMYPFATQNKKDYYNLMSVYMDAVFNPLLKESDFRQEGWRLEHENLDDPNSPIIFKGVVFNEMKGSLSENQRVFNESLMNKLLPSHTYGFISGGDPLHIPQLTYQQLKSFHTQYYHPSNARFFSYGNFSLKDHLYFVNESYLKHYGKVKQKYSESTKVPSETRWSSEKKEHIFGRVDRMAADPAKQGTLAVSYLCSDIKDIDENFVLQVITELLTSGPNSPFYKSLIEPNIGSGFSPATGFEGDTRDTYFAVGLRGLNPKDFDWVINTCNKTIDNVIKEGFDQKRIDAILHKIELNIKHQPSNFGMQFLYSLSSLWNHDGDVIRALRVNDTVDKFKRNLSINPRFLQEKVEQYLKENGHKLILTMTPDEQFDEQKNKQEADLLNSKLSSLTQEMKKKVYEDGIILRNEQEMKQDPDCLPTLKTADLKKEGEHEEVLHGKFGGVPVQESFQPTSCVTYLKGVLNTSQVPNEIKPYIPLFTQVATKMGTKKHDYREMDQLVELKTGGLSLSFHVGENKSDMNSFEEGVLFSTYALDANVETMFSLWEEIFNQVKFEDKGRLETLMKSSLAGLVSGIADNGHLYTMNASAALVNPASHRAEQNSGLTYIKWLGDLVQQNKFEETLSKLDAVAKNVFNKKYMRLAVNFSPESKNTVESSINPFIDSLPGLFEKTFVKVSNNNFSGSRVKLGIQYDSPLPVSYASKSIPTVPYTHKDFAPLRILSRLLTSKYLLPTVREKGGAYGAGAKLTPSGVVSFYSYRDPNPAKSFEVFDQSLDWIKKKDFTEQDVEEAKLGTFQTVDAPVPPGARGSREFLYGITHEELNNYRMNLINVTSDDILRVASTYLDPNSGLREGRVLLGQMNDEVMKRQGEEWSVIKM